MKDLILVLLVTNVLIALSALVALAAGVIRPRRVRLSFYQDPAKVIAARARVAGWLDDLGARTMGASIIASIFGVAYFIYKVMTV